MYKLLVIPLLAYVQAWFELLNGNYIWSAILGVLAFLVWLGILDTKELLDVEG